MTTVTLDTAAGETVEPYVQSLLVQIRFAHRAFHLNVDGISHEQSLLGPQSGGNCLNWVVGHLVLARQTWLSVVLGMAPPLDPARLERYKRGSSPLEDGTLALPLPEMVELFDRSLQPLLAGMAQLTPQRLAEKAPFSPGNDPSETVGSLVAKLCLHEAYHVGQLGLQRRLLGIGGGIA